MRTRSNEIYLKLLAALHEQDVRYVVLRDNPTLDAPIRDLDMLVKMYHYGVRRFGINLQSAVEIVRSVQRLPDGVVRIEP